MHWFKFRWNQFHYLINRFRLPQFNREIKLIRARARINLLTDLFNKTKHEPASEIERHKRIRFIY
ncbi:MAG: hypothetical protein ACTS7D_00745 [Candidatus Hodgkinia cicadicola]